MIALAIYGCGSKAEIDPKVKPFLGTWAGEPGWSCEEPLIITENSISLEKGKTQPITFDADGSIQIDKEGPYLSINADGKSLTYGGGGSGDSFELTKCAK